jgi:hypothetical protein
MSQEACGTLQKKTTELKESPGQYHLHVLYTKTQAEVSLDSLLQDRYLSPSGRLCLDSH